MRLTRRGIGELAAGALTAMLVLASGAAMTACGGEAKGGGAGPTPPETHVVASIAVNPSTTTLQEGQGTTLVAQAKEANGAVVAGQAITWSTSDASVATVTNGTVGAIKSGSATIVAASGSVQGTATVTVIPVPVATVTITPAPVALAVGQSAQMAAVTLDAAGKPLTGRVVVWGSSDPAIVGISATGLATGVTSGSATITASSEGRSATMTVTVSPPVAAAPTLAGITPASGTTGTTVSVTVTGTNFVPGGTTVTVAGGGLVVGPVTVVSPTSLTTTLAIDGAAFLSTRALSVTTAHGSSATRAFAILSAVPSLNPWSTPAYRGITGAGTIIVILDRGIQWQHPDFIKPDGTTRIKGMLDLSGQNYCALTNPAPVEYTEAQINAALAGGTPLAMRDAVGHGTVTAGIAAGNGHAAGNGRFAGVAPDADLLIVKLASEGAPAHGTQPAEQPFFGCVTQAFGWVDAKITALGKPAVIIANVGVQLWGPTDGTSALSREIDQLVGNRPGRIYISGTGDEGGLPTHAGGTYTNVPETVRLQGASGAASQMALWYTGAAAAQVSVILDDGTSVGPVGPGQSANVNGIVLTQYIPGQEFYPVTSTSGDRFVYIGITGHATTGRLLIQGLAASAGRFDLYADYNVVTAFTDHLVPGRLADIASTRSAIVTAVSVNLNAYTDIDGSPRQMPGDVVGRLWTGSAGGPTRDGRLGVDITTAGENVFAAYATTSYWGTLRNNLVSGGGGFYGRQGAASGAAPLLVGTAALMLQINPALTTQQARALLRSTAITDGNTGPTPNPDWGSGRLNIPALIDRLLLDNPTAARVPRVP